MDKQYRPTWLNGRLFDGNPIVFKNKRLEAPPLGNRLQNYERIEYYIKKIAEQNPYDLALEYGFPSRTADAVVLDPKEEAACQWFYDRNAAFCEEARVYRNNGYIVGSKRSYFEYYHTIALNMVFERIAIARIVESDIQIMHAERFDKGAILLPLGQKYEINENPDLIGLFGGIERPIEIQSDFLGYMIRGNKWNKDGDGNLKPVERGFIDFRSGKYPALISYRYDCGSGRKMLPLFICIDVKSNRIGLIDFEYEDTVAQHIDHHYNFGGKPANRVFKDDISLKLFPLNGLSKGTRAFDFLKQRFVDDVPKRPAIHRFYSECLYDERMRQGKSSVEDWLMDDYSKVGRIYMPARHVKVLNAGVVESAKPSIEVGGQMTFGF